MDEQSKADGPASKSLIDSTTAAACGLFLFVVMMLIAYLFGRGTDWPAILFLGSALVFLTGITLNLFFRRIQVRLLELILIVVVLGNLLGLSFNSFLSFYSFMKEDGRDFAPVFFWAAFCMFYLVVFIIIMCGSVWALNAAAVLNVKQVFSRICLLVLGWFFIPAALYVGIGIMNVLLRGGFELNAKLGVWLAALLPVIIFQRVNEKVRAQTRAVGADKRA